MTNERRQVIGVTEIPANLPNGTIVTRRTPCGCYLILRPDDPPVSEFTCDHGFAVAAQRKPPPPDGIIAIG